MKFADIIHHILRFSHLDKKSIFVRKWIDEVNMRAAIPVTIYTIIMERFMYNRTVLLWRLVPKFIYNGSFYLLGILSLQLFVVALLFTTGKYRNHKVASISTYLYVLGCAVVGQSIAVNDYAIGKQVIVFLPMVSWIFALFLLNPVVSLVLSLTSFIFVPELLNTRVGFTNYVNQILTIFAFMMTIISIVRWVSEIQRAEAEEKLNSMYQKLSDISMTDELTKVKNRHALRNDFPKYQNRSMIIVMSDIDDFKYYNDSFGHDTGDLVLQHMAETLQKIFGRDSVYRFGGDEFLMVLPDWNETSLAAMINAWRIRFRVFECEGRTLHLGSTVGYAVGTVKTEHDLSQMISLADAMLYEGKMTQKGSMNGAVYDPSKAAENMDVKSMQDNLRSGEFDSVTKLPNMMYFRSKADITADILRNSGEQPVLAYLNIEHFKDFNRKYGFESGDLLLKTFGELLSNVFDNCLVCRFADDHFTLIAPKKDIEERVGTVSDELMEKYPGSRIGISCGLYELLDGSVDVSLACDCARQAMMGQRRGICAWYDDEMRKQLELRQYIADHLDEALQNGWVENVYQPIIRSVNQYVCGMEVLPRWNDPVHGILEPEIYVPVLEESRWIVEHDLYVLKQAIKEFKEYQERGYATIPLVINLSFLDLEQDDMVSKITALTEDIDHSVLHFDLSAKSLSHMNSHIEKTLRDLNELGFQIWMDGFGRENSTVDILYHGLIHGIKIDLRSLSELHDTKIDSSFLRHIISMCKEMGIATLALGVENEKEAQYLTEIGCEFMQGFWFSRNVTFEECCEQKFLDEFTIEEKSRESYYAAMSRVDLANPSRLDYNKKIETISNDIPAAICEYRNGVFSTCLSNMSFRNFLKTRKIESIEAYDRIMNDESYHVKPMLLEMVEKTTASNQWETLDIGRGGKACTCSFHLISKEGDEAISILGVVIDMKLYQKVS